MAVLHHAVSGTGAPPVVFVHGFACALSDWDAQVAHHSSRHQTVTVDLRAHGRTPGTARDCSIERYGADVAEVMRELRLPPAVLVGHSMGCRVVLEAARLLPERIAGVVLVDGSRNATSDPDGAEANAKATIEKSGYAPFAEMLFRQMFFTPSAQADDIVARALKSSAEFGPHLWPRISRWDAGAMDAAFDAIRAPVLAIQSTTRSAQLKRGPMRPGDTSPWVDYLRLRGAQVEIVPDTGHFTMLEQPETVNRLIEGFVRSAGAPSASRGR
jgi:pimeloyl-ACP methyl ester carboxylesterase